jgi:hypothetical protein
VYYYPYSSGYVFDRGFFWGVTTAFTVGWATDSLHVYHHSYYGHPYYGRSYWDRWWYRRPSINVYNTTYVRNTNVTINRHYRGDRWQPRHDRRRPARPTEPRVMTRHHYDAGRTTDVRQTRRAESREPIQFRERQPQRNRTTAPLSRSSDRDRVARQVRESRDKIARVDRDRREPTPVQASRESRFSQRATAQRRPRANEPAVTQRETRRESRPTTQRQARAEPSTAAQVQVRRESRPTPQAQPRRESRATPQRNVQRQSRPAPQREARAESRPPPQKAEPRQADKPQRKARSKDRRSAK